MSARIAAFATLLLLATCDGTSEPTETERPVVEAIPAADYVSSRTCRACHLGHYRSWSQSYHRGMTQRPSDEGVLADFVDVELEALTQIYALARQDEHFTVDIRTTEAGLFVIDPGAVPTGKRDITLTTGSHHMQFYWYTTESGDALAPLPFAYLKESARWVPRRMVFLQPPQKYERPEAERWNTTCIHCHTTRGQPNPKPSGGFASQAAELGIACEACHGPGRAHIEKFRSPLARYRSHLGEDAATEIVNPAKLDHRRASQICSQCHALWQFDQAGYDDWSRDGLVYRPGDDPQDTMWLLAPSRAAKDGRVREVMKRAPGYVSGQYWSDGQARVSGREYNGMADSACFTRGQLSCMSCHTMHQPPSDPRQSAAWADDQLSLGMDGDRACVQCHAELGENLVQHTKHAPGSSGSRCQNCHMPYTSYGLLKAIRSHEITIPSADETRETGRPNACNLCHLARSLEWTAETLYGLWGSSQSEPMDTRDRNVSLVARLALQGDAGQRALSAAALGWQPGRQASAGSWQPVLLGVLMDDPYDAVRYVAERALRSYPGYREIEYDFVTQPTRREPVAPRISALARDSLGKLPASVPLRNDGTLDARGRALLSGRDLTPIHLLE